MNAKSARVALKRRGNKASSSAPGPVRGILLQVTRFLYYLLGVGPDVVVSLELFDDVGVESEDGRKIAEQDKSFLSANPLANRSQDLWKTLRNWGDSAAAGSLDPNRTRFLLYVPNARMGTIAQAFHDAGTCEEASTALERARQLLSGEDGGWAVGSSVRGLVDAVYGADHELMTAIIARFTVDSS